MENYKKIFGKILWIVVSTAVILSLAIPSAAAKTPAASALPFAFPAVKLHLKAGDTVLTPPLQMITDSLKDPANVLYMFYNDVVVSTGSITTKITDINGNNVEIPNALIIPIKSDQSAKKGDIVLTWWQSGAGMQRAYVIKGGKTPKVSYIDGTQLGTDTLVANSFTVLSSSWQVGNTIACKDSYGMFNKVILINISGKKVLTSGWAGEIKVYNKVECAPAPLNPKLKTGDTIYVAPYGTLLKGTVTSVDKINGKFKAKYMFAGTSSEEEFSFGNVFTSMPKIKQGLTHRI